LQVPPVTKTVSGILGSLLLDRLALAIGCAAVLGVLGVAALFEPAALLGALAVMPAWVLGQRALKKRRKIDAVTELAARAGAVASLFRAPFIVMGHTHVPACQPLGDHATYINVGSWAEDDGDAPASRAHLVIAVGRRGPPARPARRDRCLARAPRHRRRPARPDSAPAALGSRPRPDRLRRAGLTFTVRPGGGRRLPGSNVRGARPLNGAPAFDAALRAARAPVL